MSYPYPAHAAAPRKKRPRWVLPLIVAVVVALLLAFIAILSDAAGQDPAPAVSLPTASASPAVNPPEPPKAAPGPLTTFGPGTYEVGTGPDQVVAGKYKTAGPEDGRPTCYWARLRNTEGTYDSIIPGASGNTEGPKTLTIGVNDKGFETTCNWVKVN